MDEEEMTRQDLQTLRRLQGSWLVKRVHEMIINMITRKHLRWFGYVLCLLPGECKTIVCWFSMCCYSTYCRRCCVLTVTCLVVLLWYISSCLVMANVSLFKDFCFFFFVHYGGCAIVIMVWWWLGKPILGWYHFKEWLKNQK
jgi:hypothetical protein